MNERQAGSNVTSTFSGGSAEGVGWIREWFSQDAPAVVALFAAGVGIFAGPTEALRRLRAADWKPSQGDSAGRSRKAYTTPTRRIRKQKAQRLGWAIYLIVLVAGEGFEPSTFGL